MPAIQVAFTDGMHSQIEEIAAKEFRSMPDLLREAMRLYLSGELRSAEILRDHAQNLEVELQKRAEYISALSSENQLLRQLIAEHAETIKQLTRPVVGSEESQNATTNKTDRIVPSVPEVQTTESGD